MTSTEEFQIDAKKKNIMMMKIMHLEKQNVKTKAKSRTMLVEEIRKIIIEETNKNI